MPFTSDSRIRDLLFLLLLALLVAWRTQAHLVATGLMDGSRFVLTQFAYSYEFGFVKRGLFGELLRQFGIAATHANAIRIANAITLLACLALALYVWRAWRQQTVLLAMAWSSAATIPHLVYDRGRFDGLLLTVTLAQLAAIESGGRRANVFVILLALLAVFVHEAYAFMFLPMIFAAWLYRDDHSFLPRGLGLSLAALLTVPISNHGVIQGMSLWELSDLLKARFGPYVEPDALQVLFRDLKTNYAYTWSDAFSARNLALHIQFLPYLVATLAFLGPAMRRVAIASERGVRAWLLLASAFSPLLLYGIAIDYFRWWSLALMNVFVVLAFTSRDPACLRALQAYIARHRRAALAFIVLNVLVGPMSIGVPYTFP